MNNLERWTIWLLLLCTIVTLFVTLRRTNSNHACSCSSSNNGTISSSDSASLEIDSMWHNPYSPFVPSIQQQALYSSLFFVDQSTPDTGHTLYPAIDSRGSLRVEGNTVVEGSLLLKTGPTTFLNVTHMLMSIQGWTASVCVVPCVHGTLNVLTCECDCLPFFTGQQCDEPICANEGVANDDNTCTCPKPFTPNSLCYDIDCGLHGTPNLNRTNCTCDIGYEGSACDDVVEDTGVCTESCMGTCIDNVCYCKNTQFGVNCVYECASPNMNRTLCPWRSNWGVDMDCVTSGGETQCVCGGGYSMTQDQIRIPFFTCPSSNTTACQATFESSKGLCCAPGVDCTTSQELCGESSNPAYCCHIKSSRANCLASGCGWCSSINQCSYYIPDSCERPLFSATSVGTWHYTFHDCTDDIRMCYQAPIDQFRSSYSTCFQEVNITSRNTCFQQGHDTIQSLAWPWLTPETPAALLGVSQFVMRTYRGVQYALSVGHKIWKHMHALHWDAIGSTSGMVDFNRLFYFEPATQGSFLTYYMLAQSGPYKFCLVAETYSTARALQLYGPHKQANEGPLGYYTGFFLLNDGYYNYMSTSSRCTPIVVDLNGLFLSNGIGLDIDGAWTYLSSYVNIQPLL